MTCIHSFIATCIECKRAGDAERQRKKRGAPPPPEPTVPIWGPWRKRAACRDEDPDLFFIEHLDSKAKEICAACPVKAECLEAHITDSYGVFGGTTQRERRRLARSRGFRKPISVIPARAEDMAAAVRLYTAGTGNSAEFVSKELGIAEWTVRRWVEEAGVLRDPSVMRNRHVQKARDRKADNLALVAELSAAGKDTSAIAMELGLSKSYVNDLRRELTHAE